MGARWNSPQLSFAGRHRGTWLNRIRGSVLSTHMSDMSRSQVRRMMEDCVIYTDREQRMTKTKFDFRTFCKLYRPYQKTYYIVREPSESCSSLHKCLYLSKWHLVSDLTRPWCHNRQYLTSSWRVQNDWRMSFEMSYVNRLTSGISVSIPVVCLEFWIRCRGFLTGCRRPDGRRVIWYNSSRLYYALPTPWVSIKWK